MYLPRTNSSTSLSSLSSFRTTDSHSRPVLPGSSIGWSTPTTAANTVHVSAQVHYSFLASQYRQQSAQRGLGIANKQGYGYNRATGQPDAEAASAATISPGSATSKDKSQDRRRDTKALRSLFAGARAPREDAPQASASSSTAPAPTRTALRDASTALNANPPPSASSSKGRRNAPHGARHGSLRDYARERIKAQEELEDVIANATDTGRLKWEAKVSVISALWSKDLPSAHPL